MDNGVEKCAGAINWQGPDSPIIAAQGDDSTTPEKDGFEEGEDFIWKFYTNDVKGTELYATAVYSIGPGVYTTNGTTVVPSVYALTSISHTVTLSDGWSGISTYVVPENDSTELIFAPIVEDMVILKSMTLVYWPGYSNQIVHWNSYEGYKIKMELPGEVTFTGTDTDKTLALGEGWSLLPVLTDQNVEVVGFFAPVLDDLIIAKSIDGMGVYWPSVGVQTLQQLNPGESYMVKLGAPGSLTFPALSAKSAIAEKGYPDPIKSDVWVTPSNTGNTHTIAFNPDAVSMFGEGDYIGVFDMNDRCVGLNQVAKDSDLVISVYGDDKTTNEKDGMYPGERFIFRLYNSADEDIREFVAEFDNQYHQDYVDNGLSLITKITSAPNGIGSEYLKYLEVYPNPATDKLYIHVPGGGDIECHLRVISANGGNVKAEATFAGRTAIDISVLPSGVYLVEITDGISNPVIKRVIKK